MIVPQVFEQVGPHLASVRTMRTDEPRLFTALVLQVTLERGPPLVTAATLVTFMPHDLFCEGRVETHQVACDTGNTRVSFPKGRF